MNGPLADKITQSRKLLKNPYAYLSEDDSYDAFELAATTKPSNEEIKKSRLLLEDPYAHLEPEGGYDATYPKLNKSISLILTKDQLEQLKINNPDNYISDEEIEKAAIKLQRIMWNELKHSIKDPIKLLDPSIAFKALGYKISEATTLGQYTNERDTFEVAGIIDNDSLKVEVSLQFSPAIQKFTSAHELGHAILHKHLTNGLHRDKPIDGSKINQKKKSIEYQADKFASYFLMPDKLLRKIFNRLFLTEYFTLNEDTIFALGSPNAKEVSNIKTLRDLSRLLAKTESYNGENFNSLAKQFGVSIEAMARRLEELELCKF